MSTHQVTAAQEEAWIQGLQQGKESVLQQIFTHYYKYLLVSAFHIVNDNDKAKDLVQDVFFEVWKKREQLQIKNLKAYLRRAVVNKGLNYLKMHKRFDWGEKNVPNQQTSNAQSPQNILETNDLQQVINNSIDGLPDKCKTIFVLSRFEKFSHKEIAAQLNISTKTIENQITKALKTIRTAVDKYNEVGTFLLIQLFF